MILVLEDEDPAARVAGHLARALGSTLVLWDLGGETAGSRYDHAFADVDLVRKDADGLPTADLHRAVITSDLTIVGATPARACPAVDLTTATGRGVLLVPAGVAAMPGSRVAVRWDGTRQAASALRDSLPLLRDAECIWIVNVHGRARRGFGPGDAARYLERHGFDSFEIEADGCCLSEVVAHQDIDLVVGAGLPGLLSPHPPEQIAEALHVPVLVSA